MSTIKPVATSTIVWLSPDLDGKLAASATANTLRVGAVCAKKRSLSQIKGEQAFDQGIWRVTPLWDN
jgi:hypothetical protein